MDLSWVRLGNVVLEFERVDELQGCYLRFDLSNNLCPHNLDDSCGPVATRLFSLSLACPWMTSRDVVIKGWRRDCDGRKQSLPCNRHGCGTPQCCDSDSSIVGTKT
ncbi:hypothetical protein Rs2_25744 [Raphanus sativus]|nr:hypothetical protein Rs2_25744 [Raphanus sativus]